MNVLIFGANGGLGQWTWKAAIEAGHDVVAFVRSPGKLDSSDPRFAKLTVVSGDVTDADAVRRACEGREVAINCTSPAGGNATLELVCPGMMVDGPASSTRVVTLDELGGASPMRVNFGDVAETIVEDLGQGKLLGHRVCVSSS